MGNVRSYYEILRIAPEATQEDIERAYKRSIISLREKITAGNPPPPEMFAEIEAAFGTLRDAQLRAVYDRERASPPTIMTTAAQMAPASAPPVSPPPAFPRSGRRDDDADSQPRELHFAFHGSGGEYFRIWIVNLVLSIVTLGIYSAWAKVRREQYFHRNLTLDGAGFDYHASPIAILKGRIIAALLFGAFSASQHFHPVLHGVIALIVFLITPWFVYRALRFRAYNSSYRGLRFSFHSSYGEAFKVFVGYALLTVISLGILTPLWIREMHQYVINNLRYGHGELNCDVRAWSIFFVLLKAFFFIVIAFVLVGVSIAKHWLPPSIAGFAAAVAYLSVFPYVRMAITNRVWNSTLLDENTFSSTMRFGPYLGIVLRNLFLTVMTLGLYWPWAKVSLARYRAECTGLTMVGSLDGFMATAQENTGAFGDAAADIFDIDIGF
ncbi:MAG TPA: DUF898 family protein [Rhodocyclaceae bacterium]|jgi:uncharacterized membrane protein YjgN (DUF898 family)|nr:DUF898 family protein [Rhodocyclaceae bacterium]